MLTDLLLPLVRGRPTLLRRSGPALDRDLAREVTAWARSEVAAV